MEAVTVFKLGLAAWALLAAGLAAWLATVTPANLPRREQMPRWRWGGALLGALALALTVPQARAVLWDWLMPWYIPIVAAFLALSVWKLDYLMARALAGVFMLAAYYYLFYSFALASWCAPVGAVLAWIAGAAGVCVAAKPCWMRDAIRWSARYAALRLALAGFFGVTAVFAVLVIFGGR